MSIKISASSSSDEVTWDAPFVCIQTPGFCVRIAPEAAWTLAEITYRGKVLSDDTGFHGFAIDLGNHRPVGAGHDEGGREEVRDIQIEADGKPATFLSGETISGSEIVFTKNSKVAALSLKSVLKISADKIEGEQWLRVGEDLEISYMIAFMFPWLASTSHWIGETLGGEMIEGAFESTGHVMKSPVRWCAVYQPDAMTAAISVFAAHSQEENFIHFFNDCDLYRKQYFKPMSESKLQAGEEFHYAMSLIAIAAEENEWRSAARQAVAALGK